MNSIIFKKDEHVKEISLTDLKRTQNLAEFDGKLPKTKPIEHHALIELLEEKLDKNNISYKLDPIFVSKAHMKSIPYIQKQYDNKHCIESYLFQRLIGRIQLQDNYDDKITNSSIGIGYDVRGITLAIGTNVQLCSNMCIMGTEQLATTFGSNRMPYDKLLQVFNEWITNAAEQRERDVNILNKMENIEIKGQDAMANLIGNMQLSAVNNAYINQKDKAPLNIGQVSDFSKQYLILPDKPENVKLIDAYNIGTNILTHNKTNIENKWQTITTFSKFIIDKFDLLN